MSVDVEYGIKKDIRNNPVVREIDRLQKREFLRTLLMTAAVVGMLLFSAWQHFKIVRSSREVEALRQQYEEALKLQRQLRLDLEAQQAPGLLDARARTELHMVAPSADSTMVIERLPAPASAAGVIAQAH